MTQGAGSLWIVATPIGNLGDITMRAIEVLRASTRVLAEDTRRTRQLLTHFGITGMPVDRFDAHATERDVSRMVERIQQGEQVVLVTDAGTPAVSDPGGVLVAAAVAQGLRAVPIPGASAVLAALVACGLGGDGRFRFLGFLPREGTSRREALALAADTPETLVLFEASNRLRATLRELADATPDRPACVARELTKVHEEFVRGTCRTLAEDEREWMGEIALVLGPHSPNERQERIDDAALDARIDEAIARGEHARGAADRLAAWSGRNRREVYARIVSRKGK